eukprot:403341714
MSDSCSQCNKYFNLTSRKPIILDEYGCIWCLECINLSLKDNPKREIYCPFDKEVVTMPEQLKEHRRMIDKLQSMNQLNVFCSDHESQITNQYCITCSKPVCSHCRLVTHNEHSLVDLKQSNFQVYVENVLRLLDEYSIEDIKSQLIKLSINENQMRSSQFKEMIDKINRIVGRVISDQEQPRIDLAQTLEDHIFAPVNRQPLGSIEEEQIEYYWDSETIKQVINKSQSKLRKEFKKALNAFEINQNQINDEIKLNKSNQDNQEKIFEEFKKKFDTISIKCNAFDSAFESTNAKLSNIEQTCQLQQNSNDDYFNKLKLLQNQIDQTKLSLSDFIKTIKIDIDKHDTKLIDLDAQTQNNKGQASINHNEINTQKLINESHALLSNDFKQALEVFEISSNKKEKALADQTQQKIKSIQQGIDLQLQQFKQEVKTDLGDKLKDVVKNNDLNIKLQAVDSKYMKLNEQVQEINGNFMIELKLLNDLITELSTKVDSIKKLTHDQISAITNKILEFNEISKSQAMYSNIVAVDVKPQNKIQEEVKEQEQKPAMIDFDKLLLNIEDKTIDEKKIVFKELVAQEINKKSQSLLKNTLFQNGVNKKFQLLFKGTTHGFNASQFHNLCDNRGPTINFILSEFGQVFGGFTSLPWTSPDNGKWCSEPSAFVFSLSQRSIHKQYRNQDGAVRHYKDWMCAFGWNSDIRIHDNCDKNSNSYCYLGNTYELPNGYEYKSNEAKSYLAGQFRFKVLEIEVYSLL